MHQVTQIALAYIFGFVSCLILYFIVHKEMLEVLQEIQAKYERLLNIVQEWQKKI